MSALIFHNGRPSPVDEVRADLLRHRVPEVYVEEYLRTAVCFEGAWDPSKHPRGEGGRWGEGGAGGGESLKSGSGGGIAGGAGEGAKDSKPTLSLKEQHQAYKAKKDADYRASVAALPPEQQNTIGGLAKAMVGKALDAAAEGARPLVWGASHLPNVIAGPLALAYALKGGKIPHQTDQMTELENKYGKRTANVIHMYGSAVAGMAAGVPAAGMMAHLLGPAALKAVGWGAAAAGLTTATAGWAPVIMAGMAVGSGIGSALLYTKLGGYAGRLAKHLTEKGTSLALKGAGKAAKEIVKSPITVTKGGIATVKGVLGAARWLFGVGKHTGQRPGVLMTKQGLENTPDRSHEQQHQLDQANHILQPGKAAMSWGVSFASAGSGDKKKDDAITLPHDEIIKLAAQTHDEFGAKYLKAMLDQHDTWKKVFDGIEDNLHVFADAPKFSLFYNGVPTPEDTVLAELMSVGFAYEDAYVLLGGFEVAA